MNNNRQPVVSTGFEQGAREAVTATADNQANAIIIKDLTVASIQDFHQLRLDATAQLPQAFGPSHVQLKKISVEQNKKWFHQCWKQGDNFIACAWKSGKLIGTIGLQRVTEGNAIHTAIVWNVFVRPVYQGQGIARRLMHHVIDRARGIDGLEILKLESSATQLRAIHFYQSQGFEVFGREPRGLRVAGDYVDVVHMALYL